MRGRFEGELDVRFLDDGRLMELMAPFGYHDPEGVAWPVPAGTRTDGASIPRFLWTLLGGPFDGRYRKAAVVHDYYCDVRRRGWRDVHKMFYTAMLAAGVDGGTAKIMYYGVLLGGPRWDEQAQHNANLTHRGSFKGLGVGGATSERAGGDAIDLGALADGGGEPPRPRRLTPREEKQARDRFEDRRTEVGALSLDELESLAEADRGDVRATARPG